MTKSEETRCDYSFRKITIPSLHEYRITLVKKFESLQKKKKKKKKKYAKGVIFFS